jgi:hypothetical protein
MFIYIEIGKVILTMCGDTVDVPVEELADVRPLELVKPICRHNEVDALAPVLNKRVKALPADMVNSLVFALYATVNVLNPPLAVSSADLTAAPRLTASYMPAGIAVIALFVAFSLKSRVLLVLSTLNKVLKN